MLVLDFKRKKNAHLPKPLRNLHAELLIKVIYQRYGTVFTKN